MIFLYFKRSVRIWEVFFRSLYENNSFSNEKLGFGKSSLDAWGGLRMRIPRLVWSG